MYIQGDFLSFSLILIFYRAVFIGKYLSLCYNSFVFSFPVLHSDSSLFLSYDGYFCFFHFRFGYLCLAVVSCLYFVIIIFLPFSFFFHRDVQVLSVHPHWFYFLFLFTVTFCRAMFADQLPSLLQLSYLPLSIVFTAVFMLNRSFFVFLHCAFIVLFCLSLHFNFSIPLLTFLSALNAFLFCFVLHFFAPRH